MSRTKLSVLARSLALLASVGAPCLAHAADLLPPPPPPPPPVEIGGGWYLRGDVGVGAAELSEFTTFTGNGSALPHGYVVDRAGFSDQFFAGGGVGYQFNNFLRGDVTGEYRGGGRIHASDSYDSYNPGYKSINKYDGNLSTVVVLANGYVDLGTWWGFTPFIGAGVGSAFHRVDGFYDTGYGGAGGGFGAAKEKYTSSLAWAAQAGVAFDVTQNFKVEVGYRYLNMGTAKTGAVVCSNDPNCSLAYYKIKDIDSHDVKIGLRYLLGGVAAPLPPLMPDYAPPPGPIVRKY